MISGRARRPAEAPFGGGPAESPEVAQAHGPRQGRQDLGRNPLDRARQLRRL